MNKTAEPTMAPMTPPTIGPSQPLPVLTEHVVAGVRHGGGGGEDGGGGFGTALLSHNPPSLVPQLPNSACSPFVL